MLIERGRRGGATCLLLNIRDWYPFHTNYLQ